MRRLDGDGVLVTGHRLTGDLLERANALLLQPLTLGRDPLVVPPGQKLLTHQDRDRHGVRVRGHGLGHRGPQLVEVAHDVGGQRDAGAVRPQQTGAAPLGLEDGTPEARQCAGVGALGPEDARHLRPRPLPGQGEERDEALLATTQHDRVAVHDEPPSAEEAQATNSGGTAVLRHGSLPPSSRVPGGTLRQPRRLLPIDCAGAAPGPSGAGADFPTIGVEVRSRSG